MTDRARELLERAYGELAASDTTTGLLKEIRDFLSTPEPKQDEPVAWFSPTSKTFSTVETSHHTARLFLHPAPRPEFVRLSDEKVMTMAWDDHTLALIQTVQDALEEKNRG